MKVTVNRSGFTLVELLAVIALLALLVTFVVPSAYQYLSQGTNKALSLQEKNVIDAATLYLEDYCTSPINSNYTCQLTKDITTGFARYSGYVKLDTLINSDYIDEIVFKGQTCTESYVKITDNEIDAFLKCGEIESEGYSSSYYNEAI